MKYIFFISFTNENYFNKIQTTPLLWRRFYEGRHCWAWKDGTALSLQLMDRNIDVVGLDQQPEARNTLQAAGGGTAETIDDLLNALETPRTLILLVPAGDITENVFQELRGKLVPDDLIIDAGNAHYRDTLRRHEQLKNTGILFADSGTSGGISGARNGLCAMVGADEEAADRVKAVFEAITIENGFLLTGEVGSGHYLKMIHNGIEYGMMQSIGEGFELLEKGPFEYHYESVADMWNHGSVIRGWLMELTAEAFKDEPKLESIKGVMHSSGEGKWTVEAALDYQASAPVIAMSQLMRYRSLDDDPFHGKVVAALRHQFGGHAIEKKE
ncbi:6-phosphogluconate dehydrogenase, decarboxylating [Geomicrobium sp. JCM 19037]|uniref:phosphogluconate dehydrogenase (NAD(+)-dependent, decarboxylating) n=1 Tax=Geomicrobium sp. JCM 19037 TaxID=1460634 RepID=UPI00045F45CB|nr:decarboxylating 6-phosphogluconate dehydrogenase [Geomicrobium sp. JCM 19037]GAK02657.1 6-phosphogluconate dehydrogenase, decarboxylating [Geomicrobium sp. JCM 19037]